MSDSLQPMNCSTPGFPTLHPEFAQIHVHWVRMRGISSSVARFSYCPQSFPVRSFPVICLYTLGGPNIGYILSCCIIHPWVVVLVAGQSLSHIWLHGLQHARLFCSPLSPGVCSNSGPLSRWCYLTITCSTASFSFAFDLSQHQNLF